MKNNWKVKESLNNYTFWVLLNLITSSLFMIITPLASVPCIILAIYYLIVGPNRDKRIKKIQDLIDRLEKENENKK